MKKTIKSLAVALAGTCTLASYAGNLSVGAGSTHTVSSDEAYETVALGGGTVSLKAGQLKCQSVTASASSTIRFDGGKLAASSWDKTWFQPSSGATLQLESVDGKDIYLDVGYQRHYFSSGAGTVATAGAGNLVVNSLKDGSGNRMYLTFNANNVTWGHAGDLIVRGQGGLRLARTVPNANSLPSGAATGGIKLEGSTELYIESQAESLINSLEGPVRAQGWGWLKFGHSKSGALKNAPAIGDNCVVEKHGTDTTLTLDNTSFGTLDIQYGGVVATGQPTTMRSLIMGADTQLDVVDARFSATEAATFKGGNSVTVGASGVFDAVGVADAIFLLDSAGSLVKRGAGAWDIYPSQALSGRVQVSGGSLKLRYKDVQNCANDQWWRISITGQAWLQKGCTLAEIGLFAGGDRVNGGLTATQAATASMSAGTAKITSGDFASYNVANLFDSNGSTIWGADYYDPPADAPKIYGGHPLTVVLRLASSQAGKNVTHVDVSNFSYYGNDHVTSFTVESSADGENWISRGTYSGLGNSNWTSWTGGSSHFPVTEVTRVIEGTGQGGVGLLPGTVVRVDAGATLDLSLVKASDREISALEIDAAIGGGTITDAVFAREGTVNLLNASREALKTLKLPLSLVRADGAGNIRNWNVAIGGNVVPGWGFHVVDGEVVFTPPGTTIVIR